MRTYKDDQKKSEEKYKRPSSTTTVGLKPGSYEYLEDNGLAREGAQLKQQDIIIGKVQKINAADRVGNIEERDISIAVKDKVATVDKVLLTTNHEGFATVKIRVQVTRIPQIGDKFSCYTPDHEVLTTKGWVAINKITKNHLIASLQNGDTLSYVNPTEIQSYDYDSDEHGPLYSIKSNHVDLLVTPNHRMWVGSDRKTANKEKKFSIEKAEDIYHKRISYQMNVVSFDIEFERTGWTSQNDRGDFFILPGIDELEEIKLHLGDWCIFHGIWMAEGCMLRDWGVSFSTHKQRVKDELTRLSESLGLKIFRHKDQVNDEIRNRWNFNDKRLVSYFTGLDLGAVNKNCLMGLGH